MVNKIDVFFYMIRTETKKLEEEQVELNRQVAELSPEGRNALIQKLEDEIKDCKAILKCGVCFDRPKEVRMMQSNPLYVIYGLVNLKVVIVC